MIETQGVLQKLDSAGEGERSPFRAIACARKSHVSIGLSPFNAIKLPECLVNLRFAKAEEKQQGGAFNPMLNLLARGLGVALFLAGADDRVFRRVRHDVYC